jgi:hypothetical protein
MCVSNFKAFKNYFKMKTKTPHERKQNSEEYIPQDKCQSNLA